MKFQFFIGFCCILFLTILGCSKDNEPAPRTFSDIEADFAAFEVRAGTQDLTLEIIEGITYSFRVIFPDVDLSNKLPMVLTLHGYSAGDVDAHKKTDCYVEPGLAGLDVIIISPNGGAADWEVVSNQDMLRILTDLSSRFWPVDVAKIVVTGYSNGGNGSWFYAETQSAIFSAAIPLAAGYIPLNPDGSGRKIDIPMYIIHGEEDDLFPLDSVQNWVNLSINAGSEIEFVVAPGLGHYTPCDYISYFQDAAVWLENEVWQ